MMNRPKRDEYHDETVVDELGEFVIDADTKYRRDLEKYCDELEEIIDHISPDFVERIRLKILKERLNKKYGLQSYRI